MISKERLDQIRYRADTNYYAEDEVIHELLRAYDEQKERIATLEPLCRTIIEGFERGIFIGSADHLNKAHPFRLALAQLSASVMTQARVTQEKS